jgi:signal transduction histidine kinase/ActR/RegA family two-component response regulator
VKRYAVGERVKGNFMRLAEFVLANIEPILAEWEVFARNIWPAIKDSPVADPAVLRNDAEKILRSTATDMRSPQTGTQQGAKSQGHGDGGPESVRLDEASESHGTGRAGSGFELWAVVAEYRALRASVLRLWRESGPTPDLNDLDDVTRFNESMDQSLTEAVRAFTERVERDRKALLGNEQAARTQAEAANRAKDMFLATLSHELRTPLNAIVGWLTILRLGGRSEATLAEGLDVIDRNTKAQVQLIEDVLDVSRIVSGKLRLEIGECDLINTINASVEAVRPAAAARNITLDVQLDATARRASCDATRIQQIVWNLLTNAIKFTPNGGTVHVTLVRERSFTRITVADNGRGISPDLLPHVFERFRQADSSTRRMYGGLGLGLSIVKNLAEMHGGTAEAESAGEGQGATFTVRLPVAAVILHEPETDGPSEEEHRESESSAAFSDQPPVRLDDLHLLVVEDDVDARRMLEKALEGVGARVTAASSAAEALMLLADAKEKSESPDVLVSDVGMPEQDGYDLIRELRRRGHLPEELPAVALTAFAQKDDTRAAILAGFQIHLVKPVNLHELTTAISRLAGRTGERPLITL